MLQGSSNEPDEKLKLYFRVKDELSIADGCVLRGSRVVVPEQAQLQVLSGLHMGHPGMSRMKSLGRSFVWWQKRDVANQVNNFANFQLHRKSPASAPLHP